MSNFDFLESRWEDLAKIGRLAERNVYADSNTCLFKLGLFAETLVLYMMAYDQIDLPEGWDNTQNNRIRILKRYDMLPKEIDDTLFVLRKNRNDATHNNYESIQEAKRLNKLAFELAVWFMQTYGDYMYQSPKYTEPRDSHEDIEELKRANSEQEEYIKTLEENYKKAKAFGSEEEREKRREKSYRYAANIKLDEKETRKIIDEQLRLVGWSVDSEEIRYDKGSRPTKNKNLAISEWPTNSELTRSHTGKVDYALFVSELMVGIIEAKRQYKDIPSVIDNQCKDYAKNIKPEHYNYVMDSSAEYKAPFMYATNGRPYLKQLETKSGIWYLDGRSQGNIPRALQGWPSPQGLLEELEKDIEAANHNLENTDYDLLRDKDGLSLYEHQIKAIEKAEEAVRNGKTEILLSMATGTGKTRTILGLIYRFLVAKRFRRILFLVDRRLLGIQAMDTFKDVKIEELMTLNEIYNINDLKDAKIDPEVKIQVATVQSLVKRILYNEGDQVLASTDYDLIIIDEAHRGYILDKEMDEDEFLYRNQSDFMSKYRTVIEFFDATKIALTATPALHTTQIFGKPVFNYSYREAVIDGYLVDHNAPHDIGTKLSTEGIHYKEGDTVAIYDPVTGEITNSDELEDELNFEVESFNRQVITENFNRAVLEEICESIDPEGEAKTLIFAVDDTHADLIVKILKEIYEPYGVDNNSIIKITGSIHNGNKDKIEMEMRRFKNEKNPTIVVTVDLLTTGIDVRPISNIVFMRRVKSRILFEQMLGRATRLCPEIGKTHFEIFDPVGVYEALEPVNTMKPVVSDATTTFEDLLNGLDAMETEKQKQKQIDMIIAKLQRKKSKLSDKALEHFEDISGCKDPNDYIDKLKGMSTEQAENFIKQSQKVFEVIKEGTMKTGRPVIIDDHEDEVIRHTRGYGNATKPEDYLSEFKEFINSHINEIAALNIICTKPKELTREDLRKLKLELDRHNFTETQLNTAYKELSNLEITADIIGFIRQQALGTPLVSHEERIRNAISKLKQNHSFNAIQGKWMDRIEKQLLHENIIDEEVLNSGAFSNDGGFNRLNKIFKNKLKEYITEINEYLYDETQGA
jgi:type I restriction enzyme R subunit